MFDLIRGIRDAQGAELFSELGKWKLGPESGQFEFVWDLIDDNAEPVEYGEEPKPSKVRVSTTFVGDGQVKYRLYYNGHRVSVMMVDFAPKGDSDEKLVAYFELMDQLFSIADGDIAKNQGTWSGSKPSSSSAVKVTQEPKAQSLTDIIASGDEDAILRAAQKHFRWKTNEVIDLYATAKRLGSNRLMNLVRKISTVSMASESIHRVLVNTPNS